MCQKCLRKKAGEQRKKNYGNQSKEKESGGGGGEMEAKRENTKII